MGTSDMQVAVIAGRRQELQVSGDGLALTQRGVAVGEVRQAVARYDEIAAVEAPAGQRRLRVAFADQRPAWEITRLPSAQAQWAERLIRDMIRRSQTRASSLFTQGLAEAALREAIGKLATPPAGDPSLLAEMLLHQAVWHGATDLHLQPTGAGLTARFRVDGQLHDLAGISREAGERVLARLKVLAGIPTYLKQVAQSGRLSLACADRTVDIRLTCLPTIHGEKLTARLFDPARRLVSPEALGMAPATLAAYQRLVQQPRGCILLIGPAGAGKSTTLYASLEHLAGQSPPRSLATVEDPVEFDLAGVDQTEVNRAVGLDFAAGLRTVLRQDPQVIMVGEIRDPETAQIAVQAGLTGHLVFSTVHAPGTAGVFARLADLGVEPYLVASSVTAVMAQRLVRRLCPGCSAAYSPDADELQAAGLSAPEATGFRRAQGCVACGDTGYSGRTGIFELLTMTSELRAAITAKRTLLEIEALVRQAGAPSLWDAGLEQARQGVTTLAELISVLGRQDV